MGGKLHKLNFFYYAMHVFMEQGVAVWLSNDYQIP